MIQPGSRIGPIAIAFAIVVGVCVRVGFLDPQLQAHAESADRREASVAVPPTPATNVMLPTLWVLAVGVSKYAEPALQLQFAAKDARELAATLKRQEGRSVYKSVEIILLEDETATRDAILGALAQFRYKTAPTDVGVIYLSGHSKAMQFGRSTSLYFLPVGARQATVTTDGINMDDFAKMVHPIRANLNSLVVIMDICREGEDQTNIVYPTSEGMYVLAATLPEKKSVEIGALGHGAYTSVLLKGLNGEAADPDGNVTVERLSRFTRTELPELTKKYTGQEQIPHQFYVVGAQDLRLAAYPKSAAAAGRVTPVAAVNVATPTPRQRREGLLVARFRNRSQSTSDSVGTAIDLDVFTKLFKVTKGTGLEVRNMASFETGTDADPIDVAQRAGIDNVVMGAYSVHDQQLVVSLDLINLKSRERPEPREISGPLSQLPQLTGPLVLSLLSDLGVKCAPQMIKEIVEPTTRSADRLLLFDGVKPGGSGGSPTPPKRVPAKAETSFFHNWPSFLSWASSAYAATPEDLQVDIRTTLERYRAAFAAENLDALATYYVTFTEEQRAALQAYFETADQLRVEFIDVEITLIGDRVSVSFTREDQFVDRDTGEPQKIVARLTKLFAKGPHGWQIVPSE